jgi:nucleoside-triphosphatase THEP1
MQLQRATRKQARIRIGLQGPSGSGKTFGALQIAKGLTDDFSKVVVIDTEQHSASLYSHLGDYNVVNLASPFTPEKYIEAIRLCEQEGMEVIIIDSTSHEWEGVGGILDIHSSLPGNSFTAWSKVTPRHNAFVQSIMQSSCHIIATVRSKQDYVLVDKNGRQVPEKVGLKGVQREGLDYEMTIMFELDVKHNAIASKDRTSMFAGKPEFKLTPAVGEQIREWCEQGDALKKDSEVIEQIDAATSVEELKQVYDGHPEHQVTLLEHFSRRRKQIEIREGVYELLNPQNMSANGQHHNQ